jgi:hypothetical protein
MKRHVQSFFDIDATKVCKDTESRNNIRYYGEL